MASSSSSSIHMGTSSMQEVSHAGFFSDLLTYDKNTPLKSLINTRQSSLSSLISAARGSALTKKETKALSDRIKMWNSYLDKNLYDSLYHHDRLLELRLIAKSLFEQNKTLLIRNQLHLMHIQNKSILRALDRFDELIIRIRSVPLPKKRPEASTFLLSPAQHFLTSSNPKGDTFNLSKAKRLTKSDSALYKKPNRTPYPTIKKGQKAFAHTITDMNQRRFQLELLSRRFEMINESNDPYWKELLIKEFSKLDTKEKIIAVAENLSYPQVFVLTENAFTTPENVWKFPFFILSVSSKSLENLLASIDEAHLNFLNRLLVKQPDSVTIWMNEIFLTLSQESIYAYNKKESDINELADIYRFYHNPNSIETSEINQFEHLLNKLKKKRKFINRLRVLGLNVIYDSMVNRALWDTQAEYKKLAKRLSDHPKYIQSIPGNVFEIVHSQVFAKHGLADDDEAIEMLAGWNIVQPIDYKNIGLLPGFTDEEFNRWNTENRTVLYRAAAEYLGRLGIQYISDWKRKRIFSPLMLKDLLCSSL